MANYSDFNLSGDHSYNLYNALKYCRENNEPSLIFDKGIYHFCGDMASEDVLCVSNHDIYGIQRIAFLLKDMKDFCIDGGGSEFVFHGPVIPFAVKNSQNITVKNLSIDVDDVMTMEVRVDKVNADASFDVSVVNECNYHFKGNMLYFTNSYGQEDIFHYFCKRSMGNNKSFLPESGDVFRVFSPELSFENLGDKKFRVHGSGLTVRENMHLITRGTQRFACNMALIDSKNIRVDNVTMYKSYAMGLIAQKCENVSIDRMTVKAKDDSLFSLNCDATHFVHCKGLVKVTNSSFSEQQDDAINIHGIFTKIVDKTDDYIIVKYMHKSAKGIDIYQKGSTFCTLNQKTLIPNGTYKIADVEVININYTKIYVESGTENINVGDVVEDITWSCDLIFENNKILNNRARGMLIAAKGKVTIKNNYISTPGVGILFESDGEFWFESGGTTDVEICNNIFDNCTYTNGWGSGVIWLKPRSEFNEGQYYHKNIRIINNRFVNNTAPLLYADNAETLVFRDNVIENQSSEEITEIRNCGNVDCQ